MSTSNGDVRLVLALLDVVLVSGAMTVYLRAVRSLPDGRRWPVGRTASFGVGLLGFVAASLAMTDGAARSTFWLWLSLSLVILLIVPLPLMWGRPLELAETTARAPRLRRLFDGRTVAVLHSPVVAAALIPIVCAVVFFGPVPGWAAASSVLSWVLQVILFLLGAVIAIPLTSDDHRTSSLAIGAAVAISLVELLVDAVPGIVMRLSTHAVNTFAEHAGAPRFGLDPIRDQQIAGAILWAVAELLDLPFLVLIYFRWARADAREAATLDARLDAEASEQDFRAEVADLTGSDPEPSSDQPWFLNDPRLRDRFR